MKRLIIMLFAAMPLWVNAAADDLFMNQRDHSNTNTLSKLIPATPSDGILGYVFRPDTPSNRVPYLLTLGQGLTITGTVLDTITSAPTWASVSGKPTFSPVATSGAYADLSGIPTIPNAQQQVDWNAATGITSIANKPMAFPPSAHTQAFSTITATPTSCAGYGILDCVTPTSLSSTLAGYATTGALTSGLAGKFNSPTGSTAQYVRGDGSLATLPAGNAGTVTSITAGTGLSGGTITTSGTISLPSTGTAGSYANITTDAQGRVTSGTNRSQTAATRALNTAFQVSATRDSWVSYSVQITVTASIAGGQNGDVILEIASDSGFTANVQTLAVSGVGQTYTLAIALQGVQPQTVTLPGYVPAGYYARLRTVNNTGTPTYLYRAGQEVLQ